MHAYTQGQYSGKPISHAPARARHAACLLPGELLSKRVVIYGGERDDSTDILSDVFVLNVSNSERMEWSKISPTEINFKSRNS